MVEFTERTEFARFMNSLRRVFVRSANTLCRSQLAAALKSRAPAAKRVPMGKGGETVPTCVPASTDMVTPNRLKPLRLDHFPQCLEKISNLPLGSRS